MDGEPPKAKPDPKATIDATATVKPATAVDPKATVDPTATMTPAAKVDPRTTADDPPPGTRSGKHRGLLVGLAVVVVGLVAFSAIALFGDDDSKPSPSSSATTVRPQSTTVRPQSTTVAPSPTTTAAVEASATPADTRASGSDAAGVGPGYDSEECALFRELLALVDDAALRAGAAEVGCI